MRRARRAVLQRGVHRVGHRGAAALAGPGGACARRRDRRGGRRCVPAGEGVSGRQGRARDGGARCRAPGFRHLVGRAARRHPRCDRRRRVGGDHPDRRGARRAGGRLRGRRLSTGEAEDHARLGHGPARGRAACLPRPRAAGRRERRLRPVGCRPTGTARPVRHADDRAAVSARRARRARRPRRPDDHADLSRRRSSRSATR